MQKNAKPLREYEGPFVKNRRAPKKEFGVEGRYLKTWDGDYGDSLTNLFKHMSEWHSVRKYSSLKQAQQAVAALSKNGRGWEYRVSPNNVE